MIFKLEDIDLHKNYYESLFLKRDCDQSSIKKSYRKLSFKYHPDKNSTKNASKKFQLINEAYIILSDIEKRLYYDMNSFYGNLYKEQNHTSFKQTDYSSKVNKDFQQREKFFLHSDIKQKITISFKQLYDGKSINVMYYRKMMCDDCSGYGNDPTGGIECAMCDGTGETHFSIKKEKCQMCGGKKFISQDPCQSCKGSGIYEKKQIISLNLLNKIPGTFSQELSKGGNYIKSKNLYGKHSLEILIESDHAFKIDENRNLHRKIDIHYEDAILGNDILYYHIDDIQYPIIINPKSKDKDIIKLPNLGMKDKKSRTDLFLHLNIVIDYDRI